MKASKDRRASRKNTPRKHTPHCLLDYLESRVLLDGNVAASVSAGTLTLQGDNLNNSIIIDQAALASGQFRLSSGDASTTINGSASPQTFDNVTNIVINAGAGNDTLVLQNASVDGNVQVNGANGNQAVELNALTIAGDFTLTNTGGQNSTTLENSTTIQGNVIITAGLGFDPSTGSLWASPLFADANQIFTLSNSTVDNAVLISNGSSETTTTIDNNSTINTDLLLTNGALSYGSMGFNSANSPAPAGDLFILNASTVGDSISITNASNGNATVIEGGSSVTNNLTVSNAGDADCGCMTPGSSDSFTLTDSSSINGDVTLSNTSNGSSILITNFGFIGGSLNVTNTAAADCPCCTLNYGQPTPSFGDYLTLSDGAFVGADVNISNGSTYNSTDIDSNFIGGNLTLTNGPDFTAATYTTDLFTLNDGFVGGSVSISNAAGDINTTISNTIISVSLSVTNLNGNTFFENTSPTDPTNYQDSEQTAPVPPPPPPLAITTTQQPATVTVGNSIADQATLTGGCDPTGTVTFTLFSNPTATGTPLFTDTETLSNGIATSAAYTTTATGTDYWLATYNGDCMNLSLSTGPADEPVTIAQATPSISTTQQPATITVGGSIADKATVTGGFNPTGTVTFQLYNNPNATGTALFTDTETLSAGTATSANFTTTAPGTDYWVATYNGNTNNNSVTSSTAGEPATVNQATPLISTTQQPATITVGNSIADKATITAGFNPTGTVTFQLFNNPNATGTALFTDTETLSSGTATSASYTTTATGTDYWLATYNGNTNNKSVTSTLAGEPVTIAQATPLITTTQQPATITVGGSIADKATITAGFNPTGTVTFQLYNNPNATGTALFTDTETLSSGTATSANFTTTTTGTVYWLATYNGNSNNVSVTSGAASEPVTVTGAPKLTLTKTADQASITVGQTAGYVLTITNSGTAAATGLTLSDPLPAGAGNDVNWTIDNHIDNPAAFTITGTVGNQVLSLNGQPISLAAGASLSVHITGITSANDSLTSTNPALNVGGLAAYTVLYEGTGNNQLSISNDTINGNIGVGGGQVQFNGPGTIVGRLDFSGPNTSQYHNTNGSNVGPTSLNYSAAAVTTAIKAVNSLSTSLGALAGTNISFNNSNQTVNESSGTLHTSNGVTYRVFNVTSYSENNSDTVTINGDGSGDPVVFNFAYSSNTNLGGKVALTGGLADDQLMWNFTSSGKQVQLNNNGGTYIGVIIAPNDQYQSDSSNLYGRVYGGTAGNMQIVSGANVYAPPMTGTLSNTATVSASNVSTVNASATITIQPAPGATTNAAFNDSLSGTVFNDVNKNGNIDPGDTGIAGVQLTLTGVNDLGISVTLVTTTNTSGAFSFANLRAGTYTLTETQPAGYSTTKDVAGTAGGSVQNDMISNIVLKSGVVATGYNFGEH